MTRRELISSLIDTYKEEYQDSLLSPVLVWNIFNRKVQGFLEQQSKDKKLWKDNTAWKSLCINLIEVDNNDCGCLPPNLRTKIFRSKCELPKIFNVSSGHLIKSILPIDNNIQQEIILSTEISAINKKKIAPNKMFAFIKNNYLYVLGEVESVTLFAMFEEIPNGYCGAEKTDSSSDSTNHSNNCINAFLDAEIGVSNYVTDKVYTATLQELANTFIRIPQIPPINTSPV